MSTELGNGGSLPSGTSSPINIPTNEAPQPELKLDSNIQIFQEQSAIGDTYKLKANSFDPTPGYLDAKISTQFSISSYELYLVGFGSLSTTDLTEGTNLYYTSARFDSDLALKTTDDLNEGVSNKYYSETLFDTSLSGKDTGDLSEGVNLYFTNARAITALDSHTSDTTIHFSNLSSFDTDDLSEGSNLYFTDARAISALSSHTSDSSIHFSDLSGFTTDNLTQGSTNLYISSSQASDIVSNTSARHSHANKSLLDSYTQSEVAIANAVTLAHSHTNKTVLDATEESFTTALKAQYDSLTSGSISSTVAPLDLTTGVLSHDLSDGNKHVPSNASASEYAILISGASAGVYSWSEIETIIANSNVFESSPSTSTTTGVTSNYINTHVSNGTANVNHITDADATYIGTTIPAHIASTTVHVPAFSASDNGKFLYINGSTQLAWTNSSTNIQTSGESYVSAAGDTITMSKIDLTQTNFIAGDNITFSTNTISATQRAITGSPSSGDNTTSISSNWAYFHYINYGNYAHLPAPGSSGEFLAWDGTYKDVADYAGTPDVLDYVLSMQEDNTLDPGISPTTGDRYIILDSTDLNANFGTITGVGDNDIVQYDGANFVVSFDSSATTASVEVTVTTDINSNSDRRWYYSFSGVEWRDRGITGENFWARDVSNSLLSPSTAGDDIRLPLNDVIGWDTGVSYITASNTNEIGVYTDSTERFQINTTNIIANLPITVNTIDETTAGVGVTIDSVLIKDNSVTAINFNINDSNTQIGEDGSSNMTFTDAVTGTKTLAQLAAASGPSYGTDDQIPHMNSGGIDFDYSANLTYDGVSMLIRDGSNENTFIGNSAGKSGVTGSYNIGIGWNTMGSVVGGSRNIGIGYLSSSGITTGTDNTIIGSYAGNTVGSSVNNSVFLGAYSGRYETGSNKLFIDNQSRTDEATSRTSSLIYGEFNSTVASQLVRFNSTVQLPQIPAKTTETNIVYFDPTSGALSYGAGAGSGTVTSVGMTVPTGFTIANSPITTSGTLIVGFDTGYSLPSDADQSQWDTAYGWGNHANGGYLTSVDISDINATGSPSSTTYLRGDGVWASVATAGSSYGNENEIPITNSSQDDFDYSLLFKYDGTRMFLSDAYANISIGNVNTSNPSVTGTNNISIGFAAGFSQTDGDNNVFIGSSCGQSSSGGDRNVFLGYLSGLGNDGDDNVLLGYYAGNATGINSRNVCIGAHSGKRSQLSDRLFIDNQDRTNAANELTNSLVYGEFNSTVNLQKVYLNASTYTPRVVKEPQTLTSSAAISMNVRDGQNANLTLAHNATLTLSNLEAGDEGNIDIINSGSYTLTISPTPYVINDGAGVVTLTASGVDVISYYYTGTYLRVTYGPNYTNS